MTDITLLYLFSRLWAGVSAHGAVVFPPPRNNIDHGEAPWDGEVPTSVPAVSDPQNGVWCPIPNPFFNNNLTGISSDKSIRPYVVQQIWTQVTMARPVSGFLTAAPSDVPSVTARPGVLGSTITRMTPTSAAWVTRPPCVTPPWGQSTRTRSADQTRTATTSVRGAPPAQRPCLTRVGWRGAPPKHILVYAPGFEGRSSRLCCLDTCDNASVCLTAIIHYDE